MSRFSRGMYNFWLIDQAQGRMSHTKFWSNVGYLIMCATFPYAVVNGSKVDYMLWLLFGAVVIGNRTLSRALDTSGSRSKKDVTQG